MIWQAMRRGQVEHVEAGNRTMGPFQVSLRQLQTGLSSAVWQLKVAWGDRTVLFLPTRGMSIEEVQLGESRWGWHSPVPGPVHPSFVPLDTPDGLGWLHGFTELLVRCGLTSNGAPQFKDGRLEYPLHGRIGNLPAQSLTIRIVDDGCLEIEAEVDEVRFHFQRWRLKVRYRLFPDADRIEVCDTVANLAGRRYDFQMLYHFNLGPPLLAPGGRIQVAAAEVAPRSPLREQDCREWNRIHEPRPGEDEQVFFLLPTGDARGQSLAWLSHPGGHVGAGIEFNIRQLPCLSLWKNYRDPRDGYVIGLEPGTNYPNARDFEAQHGRTRWLEPGESVAMDWTLHFARSAAAVRSFEERVSEVQGEQQPILHLAPKSAWSFA